MTRQNPNQQEFLHLPFLGDRHISFLPAFEAENPWELPQAF